MKPLYLTITDDQIMYSDSESTTDEKSYEFTFNGGIKQDLQNFRDSLTDSSKVLVITNPSQYILKKNAFKYQDKVIDFGNELENVFHVPVINLEDLTENKLSAARETEKKYSTWHLDYYGIDHGKRQYGQESMQTIGNGFFGLRGTYFEAKANDDNYPATYVAGVFNQLATPINGRNIINEDLVNLPNAQYMTFSIDDGPYFQINEKDIQESLRSLNMKDGSFTTTLIIQLADGKKLRVTEKKVVDMVNYHDYYMQYSIQPLNFSSEIKDSHGNRCLSR
jgi:Trehalose and maltose hydrolases (possible phosphorylases)